MLTIPLPPSRPTFCEVCGKLLWGMSKQGVKCRGCKAICHRKCQAEAEEAITCRFDAPAYVVEAFVGVVLGVCLLLCAYCRMIDAPLYVEGWLGMHIESGRREGSVHNGVWPVGKVRCVPRECTRMAVREDWQGSKTARPQAREPRPDPPMNLPRIIYPPTAHIFTHRPVYVNTHELFETSFSTPTYCNVCRKVLKGIRRQGLSCSQCSVCCHESCKPKLLIPCKTTHNEKLPDPNVCRLFFLHLFLLSP